MLKGLINLITFIRFRKGKAHAKASTFVSSAHPANHVAQRRLRASFKLHFYPNRQRDRLCWLLRVRHSHQSWRGLIRSGSLNPANSEGVLLWRKGVLTTIAEAGQLLTDGGIMGYTLSPVQMNDHGEVAFIISRDGPGNFPSPTGWNAGVYRYDSRTGINPVMVPGTTPVPGGGSFWGSLFVVATDNRDDIYFPAMICTTVQVKFPTQTCPDGSPGVLTYGAYKADAKGTITPMVVPGDAAPGPAGSYFDFTHGPASNTRGVFAFTAHVFTDVCAHSDLLYCWDSVFLKKSPSGEIVEIARVGKPSPVPGRNYGPAYGPLVTPNGDVAFIADVSPNGDFTEPSVLLYSKGKTIVIAAPGYALPGGGHFARTGFNNQSVAINNAGEIVFNAALVDGAQGIYVWRHGSLALVAKTGTNVGTGIVANVDQGTGDTQVAINDSGQVLFSAQYQAGGGGLLIATPK